MTKNYKNILIFGHSNIGDVCYDLAVVYPLRRAYPDARISFVTSKKSSRLGIVVSGVDELIIFDKHGEDKGITGYLRFIRKIRSCKFDLGIILRDMQMYYFFNIPAIVKLKKSDVRDNTYHVAQKYMRLLSKLGIEAKEPKYEFKFSDKQINYIKQLFLTHKVTKDTFKVGIMPLAGWALKCWPVEHWNTLIDKLSEEFKAKIFLIGKTGSIEWEKQFKQKISSKAVTLIDNSSIDESSVLIHNMDLFIGPDTSFLHLASCMRIPTVGLYGATDSEFIYPFFHKEYITNSRGELECMPCYPGTNGGSCKSKGPGPCMEKITPEEVMEKIKQVLKK
ncbi:MAG: glycosyltransferase family 9 protein [Candidatus Omnitrophica bacterium]|nr:glycosyltransferase family 9 protein [Candidatus Omnitrophota bacterium]MBU4479330.1 glycosyltransferase family 9 protein [Candidatus Omnitrophota bacterium]MCG2704230.1 glycosyltransferase family 9 protein [Candidatus Omnitrophota bacterium]